MWLQYEFRLKPRSRGFHLITNDVLSEIPELKTFKLGILNLLIKHTSASLTINENADPTVRQDFENFFTRNVPENESYYLHQDEGPDDLPAHMKPKKRSWITKVHASPWRTWETFKFTHHQ